MPPNRAKARPGAWARARGRAWAWGLALLLPSAAWAAEARFDGSYRLRLATNTDLNVDDRPTRLGQQVWLENRFRLTGKLVERGELGGIELQTSFDIFDGLLAGDLAPSFQGLGWQGRSQPLSRDRSGFAFRSLFVELRLPFGRIELGQMPSHFGMGLVTNGGSDEGAPDFGDVRFGDLVERISFAARPLAAWFGPRGFAQEVVVAVGAELVYQDRTAQLVQGPLGALAWGDVAWQGYASAAWAPDDASRASFLIRRRVEQFARDGGDLHTWTFDVALRSVALFPEQGLRLQLEAEGAAIVGATSREANLNARTSVRLAQQGLAARATVAVRELEAEVEVGYASGDGNPFDDASGGFSFSRDYKVGLVLWDEVMLWQTQSAAARLADPALSGRPQRGLDLLPTEGAVTNAIYLKPTLRWRPAALFGQVRIVGSLLFARAPEPVLDAYQSWLASAPRNAYGAAAGQGYGVEVDLGVAWRRAIGDRAGLELGGQWGALFPGDAFAKPDGTRLGKVTAAKVRAGVQF